MSTESQRQEPIIVTVPRACVEALDAEEVLMGLSVFVRSSALAPQALGKVQIYFDGYNGDARELWEIPEVRRFAARIDAVFPYWFFLADLTTDTLSMLVFCICPSTVVSHGITTVRHEDLALFVARQFAGMNELFARHGLTMDENQSRSAALESYLSSREILN